MKLAITTALTLLILSSITNDHEVEKSRWLVTLDHLKPLTIEERAFVLQVLGIEMDQKVLDQAIQENEIPIEAFGGE